MATLYLKTAGGNFNGANWSTTGAAGVDSNTPTAADNCILELASGNLTVNSGSVCRSLDTTSGTGSYTGTITHTGGPILTIGDATAGAGNVALKFNAGMTYTVTSAISFVSTSATQQTIDFGGKTTGNWTINGAGSSYLLSSASTTGSVNTVTLTAGTLNTNGQTCSWGLFSSSGTTTRTLTLGASAITLTGTGGVWSTAVITNFTVNANTSTITATGASPQLLPGGLTLNNVVLSGSGTPLMNGALTCANFTRTGTAVKTDALSWAANITVTGTLTITGNSVTNRVLVQSNVFSATRTLTAAAVSLTNVDFTDIAGAGAAAPFTGTSLGDAMGNSGITFTSPTTQTHDGTTSSWSTAARWTSRVPLPQDTVLIPSGSGTITGDMPRIGADTDFTGFTGTFAPSIAWSCHGSLTFASGMTFTQGTFNCTANGRTTHTITSAGKSFYNLIINSATTSDYTFADAVTCTDTGTTIGLTVQRGTVTWLGNVTASVFISGSSNSKTFNMGSGTWSLTGTSGTLWTVAGTPVVINADTSTIVISSASTTARTFAGGGQTFNNLTYTVDNSPGSLTITGANTFANLNVDSGKILTMPSATTNTITNTFNVNGAVNSYQYQPGVASHYISTVDSAVLSITGDIDIRVRVALDDWTPAGAQILMAKRLATGNQRSFYFRIDLLGHLRLSLSADGIAETTQNSSTTPVVADGAILWTRATWRASDGRTQYFTADGSLSNPSAGDFTQLGTDRTIAVASIFDSTAALEIGSTDNGVPVSFTPSVGKFYRAQLRNGIDGTLEYDANFTTKAFGVNSFTESSANAATVTINGTLAQAGDGRVSLVSSTPGTAAILTKPTGTVSVNYLSIQDSTAGVGWYAGANSVNVSNNKGWVFTASPASNGNFFGLF